MIFYQLLFQAVSSNEAELEDERIEEEVYEAKLLCDIIASSMNHKGD